MSLAKESQRYYDDLPPHAKTRKGAFYISELLKENNIINDMPDFLRDKDELAKERNDSASGSNELLCGDIKDVIKSCDLRTLHLAKLVAKMPLLPTDNENIERWAKRLAADISKFND